jgi:hypothetical protein
MRSCAPTDPYSRLLTLTILAITASIALALSATPCLAASPQEGSALEIKLGIADAWKLGKPCPVRATIARGYENATHLEIDSIDGDGVEVTYRAAIPPASEPPVVNLIIRIGRENASLTTRLLAGNEPLYEQVFFPSELATELGALQPLVVGIGSTLGAELLALRTPDGRVSLSTSVVDSADDLPLDPLGMAACDLLIISTRDQSLLADLAPKQWDAIQTWISEGGGCLISLGHEAGDLAHLAGLQPLLPGRLIGEGNVFNPGPLETLVGTSDPLQPFSATVIEWTADVKVALALTDNVGRRIAWWSRYALGSGTISVVASDLEHPAFTNWKERRLLWERLMEPYFSRGTIEFPAKEAALAEASSFLGYSDIVGQLRATLDRFNSVRSVSFGQVAFILIAILILVGPIDYLISVKWLRRPELSWLLAGAFLLCSTGVLAWYYTLIRPAKVLVNSAEIIDVDTTSQRVRGNLWFHVYASNADTFDLTARALDGHPVALDWQGLPGGGLGGLSSQLSVDRSMPAYTIDRLPSGETIIERMGIPSGGTKSLAGDWGCRFEEAGGLVAPAADFDLRELSGVDQLQGYFTNPLAVDLKDATLFYHDWYYVLNSRIPAGERVVISADQIPKDLTRKLNRRRNVDGTISITRWDPADRNNLDQLLELMMFYDAASGVNYASLSHRFQPAVDHSQLLRLDRAVLIARIDQSPVEIEIARNSSGETKTTQQTELSRTWCRIILPVNGRR